MKLCLPTILVSLLLLASGAGLSSAPEFSLDTTYSSGNGQAGNMFDVEASASIVVRRIDAHIDLGSFDVEVYSVAGGYAGHETSTADWTLAGAVTVAGQGDVSTGGAKTPIPLALDVPIGAGQRVGFLVILTNGTGINYTNGTQEGAVFATDGTATIFEGLGVGYPLGASFSPRVWNGTLHYKSDCDGNGIADDEDLASDPFADIDGDGQLDACVAPPLMADVYQLSVQSGGTQTFQLRGANPGDLYMLLGSMSGTSPGTPAGPLVLPLNVDAYLMHTLLQPNQSPLASSYGVLAPRGPAGGGQATASFTLRAAFDPALVGTTAHHAFVIMDPVTGFCTSVSNAVPIVFQP